MPVYIHRASNGKEKMLAKMLANKSKDLPQYKGFISAVMFTDSTKGYIYIEGEDLTQIEQLTSTIRGITNKPISINPVDLDELQDILVPRPAIEGLQQGDMVEIINGPFKGARAKVTRIDSSNQEVTAEITSASMGLPLKLHADYVKKISSENS